MGSKRRARRPAEAVIVLIVGCLQHQEHASLREISPRTVVALMDEHREFLASKGVALPPVGEEAELDYQSLATIFLSPDDIPPELVEKFHMVKQMSGAGTMDRILDRDPKPPSEIRPEIPVWVCLIILR